jgi:hypothetical protein
LIGSSNIASPIIVIVYFFMSLLVCLKYKKVPPVSLQEVPKGAVVWENLHGT